MLPYSLIPIYNYYITKFRAIEQTRKLASLAIINAKCAGTRLLALVRYNSVFVPLCSLNTCKGVFNPNVTTSQSNCAEGLHFSAFRYLFLVYVHSTNFSYIDYLELQES